MTAMPHRVMPVHSPTYRAITPVRPTDPALAAVLLAKPLDDDVPLATWWFLAESLRHSVSVRRAAEGVERPSAARLRLQVIRAAMYAEAALEEIDQLAAGSGTVDETHRQHSAPADNATLRVTICALACLIVTSRTITAMQLRGTILAHLQALRLATH